MAPHRPGDVYGADIDLDGEVDAVAELAVKGLASPGSFSCRCDESPEPPVPRSIQRILRVNYGLHIDRLNSNPGIPTLDSNNNCLSVCFHAHFVWISSITSCKSEQMDFSCSLCLRAISSRHTSAAACQLTVYESQVYALLLVTNPDTNDMYHVKPGPY